MSYKLQVCVRARARARVCIDMPTCIYALSKQPVELTWSPLILSCQVTIILLWNWLVLYHFQNGLHVECILRQLIQHTPPQPVSLRFTLILFNHMYPTFLGKHPDRRHKCKYYSKRPSMCNVFSKAFAAFAINNQASSNLRKRLHSPWTMLKPGTVNSRSVVTLAISGSVTGHSRWFKRVH